MSRLSNIGPCEGCGEPTERESGKIRKDFYRCPSCKLLALARFMETPEPGDTLADISAGEQTGAWLRDAARNGGSKP